MSALRRRLAVLRATWRTWVALAVTLAFLSGGVYVYVATVKERRDRTTQRVADAAKAALENCLQIETIKEQIRSTVEDSEARLPAIAYYKQHPAELAQALKDVQDSVARFSARDCYALPAVRDAGLRRPTHAR